MEGTRAFEVQAGFVFLRGITPSDSLDPIGLFDSCIPSESGDSYYDGNMGINLTLHSTVQSNDLIRMTDSPHLGRNRCGPNQTIPRILFRLSSLASLASFVLAKLGIGFIRCNYALHLWGLSFSDSDGV
jgi:hypothetical protein